MALRSARALRCAFRERHLTGRAAPLSASAAAIAGMPLRCARRAIYLAEDQGRSDHRSQSPGIREGRPEGCAPAQAAQRDRRVGDNARRDGKLWRMTAKALPKLRKRAEMNKGGTL